MTISDAISNGTVTADHQTSAKDAVVKLTANPAKNYHFVSWHVTSGNTEINVNNQNEFVMPAGNVEVFATFATNDQTLTAHYQYENGAEAAPDHVSQVNVGSDYEVVSPVITCYAADKLTVSGTMGNESVEDTVTYTSLATAAIDERVACDSLERIDGVTYYETTTEPTFTLTNAAGCDSVVTLHVSIYNAGTVDLYDTICMGSEYNNYNINIPTADIVEGENDFTFVHETTHHCDSTVNLHLFVKICVAPCGELLVDIDGNSYPTKVFGHICWMLTNLRTTHYTNGTAIPFAIVYTNPINNSQVDEENFGRLYNWAANAANNESRFNKQPAGFYNPATGGCEGLGTSSHFYTSDFQPAGLIYQLTEYYCVDPFYKVSNNPQEGRSIRCVRDILDD